MDIETRTNTHEDDPSRSRLTPAAPRARAQHSPIRPRLTSNQLMKKPNPSLRPILSLTALLLLLLAAWPAPADQYRGNGNTGFGGAIGNGTLTLSDDGTNIFGTLTVGGSMNDVLVLYIQTASGGFADSSGFNDRQDGCRQAISGVSASGRSLLTFADGFQPNYAIALAPSFGPLTTRA